MVWLDIWHAHAFLWHARWFCARARALLFFLALSRAYGIYHLYNINRYSFSLKLFCGCWLVRIVWFGDPTVILILYIAVDWYRIPITPDEPPLTLKARSGRTLFSTARVRIFARSPARSGAPPNARTRRCALFALCAARFLRACRALRARARSSSKRPSALSHPKRIFACAARWCRSTLTW